MTSKDSPSVRECAWREFASLYRLGSLSEHVARDFEAHLELGCAGCAQELEQVTTILADLDLADAKGNPVQPAAGTKDRLLARIRSESGSQGEAVWKRWNESAHLPPSNDGLHTLPADSGAWEDTNIAGIAARALRVDSTHRTVTMMVRMAPGTAYPAHRHAGAEECYVLGGDLHVGSRVLKSGDYQYAEAGSTHDEQWTEGGCMLLLVSSQDDELL